MNREISESRPRKARKPKVTSEPGVSAENADVKVPENQPQKIRVFVYVFKSLQPKAIVRNLGECDDWANISLHMARKMHKSENPYAASYLISLQEIPEEVYSKGIGHMIATQPRESYDIYKWYSFGTARFFGVVPANAWALFLTYQ